MFCLWARVLCRFLRQKRNVPFTLSCVLYMYGGSFFVHPARVGLLLCTRCGSGISVLTVCLLFVFFYCICFDMLDTRPRGVKFSVCVFSCRVFVFYPAVVGVPGMDYGTVRTILSMTTTRLEFSTYSLPSGLSGLSSCDSHSRSTVGPCFVLLCCICISILCAVSLLACVCFFLGTKERMRRASLFPTW